MITITGILFATTQWNVISNFVKVILLMLLGITFLCLSHFSEEKLKIEKTTFAYYIIGTAFLFLSWVGLVQFEIISPWFSYSGSGKMLVYSISFLLLSSISYLIADKFSKITYKYTSIFAIYISVFCFLSFLHVKIIPITTILIGISLTINIFLKKSNKLFLQMQILSLVIYTG